MIALLNWRVLLAIALAGLLAFSCLTFYRKGRHDVQTQWDASIAAANSEARRLEQSRQDRANEAARIATAAQNRILADSASARRDAASLRDSFNAADQYAAQSRAAAERVAKLATGLLDECSRSVIELAEAAARADSEARELRAGWPK